MSDNGKIINISKSVPDSIHFSLSKNNPYLHDKIKKLVDLGYQGLQKIASNVILTHKKSKFKKLTKIEKSITKNSDLHAY